MQLTFLGTGDAAGVPVYGCTCSVCCRTKNEQQFRRLPCSAILEADNERILIDAGICNLAERFPVGSLSKIFITHYHMDHIQGLFHLRWGCNTTIPVHGPDDPSGCGDLLKHSGILDFSKKSNPFTKKTFGSLEVIPVPLNHSKPTLGYCFAHGSGKLAYLCDTIGLPATTLSFLEEWQPDNIVMDCTHPPQKNPPLNHNDWTVALRLVERFKSTSFWLTHISHAFDCWLQKQKNLLPKNLQIAKDGMEIVFRKGIDQ